MITTVLRTSCDKKELYNSVNISHIYWKKSIDRRIERGIQSQSLAYNIFCAVEGAIMMSRVQASIKTMQK
jgi:hypothetical protein